MLGKIVKIDIFGTLTDRELYSGFIMGRKSGDFRQVYVMAESELSGETDCMIIAVAVSEKRSQTRLIAAPVGKIYYEPEIRKRLCRKSVTFDRILCVYEKSCGAVVYHRTRLGVIKVLLVKNHNGRYWTFPKGHVEQNETEQQTAIREIKEETGLNVIIEPDFRRTSTYSPFGKIKKQVVFFLAKADESAVNLQKSEIDYYLWATIDEAMHICKYDNDTKILREVKRRHGKETTS